MAVALYFIKWSVSLYVMPKANTTQEKAQQSELNNRFLSEMHY